MRKIEHFDFGQNALSGIPSEPQHRNKRTFGGSDPQQGQADVAADSSANPLKTVNSRCVAANLDPEEVVLWMIVRACHDLLNFQDMAVEGA